MKKLLLILLFATSVVSGQNYLGETKVQILTQNQCVSLGIIIVVLILLIVSAIVINEVVLENQEYDLIKLPNGDYQYTHPKKGIIFCKNKDFPAMCLIHRDLAIRPDAKIKDDVRVLFYKEFNELVHMDL